MAKSSLGRSPLFLPLPMDDRHFTHKQKPLKINTDQNCKKQSLSASQKWVNYVWYLSQIKAENKFRLSMMEWIKCHFKSAFLSPSNYDAVWQGSYYCYATYASGVWTNMVSFSRPMLLLDIISTHPKKSLNGFLVFYTDADKNNWESLGIMCHSLCQTFFCGSFRQRLPPSLLSYPPHY
jgi:hypothetical protein